MEIEKAIEIIEKHIDEADFVGSISIVSIQKAEKILKVLFPKSYKIFLNKYGCGDIFSKEFFGIISDDQIEIEGIPNVVWLTQELRKDGLPNKYIPISETGDGYYYLIDTEDIDENDECSIFLWDFGSQKFEKNYDSFGTFLLDILNQNI